MHRHACMHTSIPVRQLIVTCHSSGHKNFAGQRSLENLYGSDPLDAARCGPALFHIVLRPGSSLVPYRRKAKELILLMLAVAPNKCYKRFTDLYLQVCR